jgi:hypothetical protein
VLTGTPLERAGRGGALANPEAVHEVVALVGAPTAADR